MCIRDSFCLVVTQRRHVDRTDLVVDGIWSNPPIRIGKAALHELQCEAYDRDNNFTGVHGFLLRLVETHREEDVRQAALAAWGTVLDNRAKPEHIKALTALASRDLPEALMQELVSVAAKFAEEGAMPLVQQLARHSAPEVRARMATALYLDADSELSLIHI